MAVAMDTQKTKRYFVLSCCKSQGPESKDLKSASDSSLFKRSTPILPLFPPHWDFYWKLFTRFNTKTEQKWNPRSVAAKSN